jgi:hypothetical protein
MASAVVLCALEEQEPGPTTRYGVQFFRDNGTSDRDIVDVTIAAGDTPNTIVGKIAAAVRARATVLGLIIPANAVAIPAFSKG